jgi:hypothetical protein
VRRLANAEGFGSENDEPEGSDDRAQGHAFSPWYRGQRMAFAAPNGSLVSVPSGVLQK